MRFIKALFLLVAFIAAMLFFVQNMQTLSSAETVLVLNLFVVKWQSMPLPLYWLILGPFAAGCLIMILYFGLEKLRLSQDLRAAQAPVRQAGQGAGGPAPGPRVHPGGRRARNLLPAGPVGLSRAGGEHVLAGASAMEGQTQAAPSPGLPR